MTVKNLQNLNIYFYLAIVFSFPAYNIGVGKPTE